MPAAYVARAWQANSAAVELNPSFSAQKFLAPIKFLSGDPFKGRGNGTPQLGQAAHAASPEND
jgi:hypothetical protein